MCPKLFFIPKGACNESLNASFPENALEQLDTFLKKEKKARLFRRAQALKSIVHGTPAKTVAKLFSFTYSALRIWIRRFEQLGVEGLYDLSRPGRPKKMTSEIESFALHLMEKDPRDYGSIYSMWTAPQLVQVIEKHFRVSFNAKTLQRLLKKTTLRSTDQPENFPPMKKK